MKLKNGLKKTFRKKRVFPRSRTNRGNKKMIYPVAPPNIQRACLKYNESYSNLIPTASYASYVWRPNCIYDPNYSGTGHQSMYRDQYFQLYSWVRCVAFTIQYKIVSDSDTPCEVVLCPIETNTGASYDQLLEYKGCKKGVCTKSKPCYLSMSFLVDRLLGNRKYTCLIDDLFKQSSAATLDGKATAWVQFSAVNRGAVGVNLFYNVSIKQYVQFSEPVNQSLS